MRGSTSSLIVSIVHHIYIPGTLPPPSFSFFSHHPRPQNHGFFFSLSNLASDKNQYHFPFSFVSIPSVTWLKEQVGTAVALLWRCHPCLCPLRTHLSVIPTAQHPPSSFWCIPLIFLMQLGFGVVGLPLGLGVDTASVNRRWAISSLGFAERIVGNHSGPSHWNLERVCWMH